MTPTARWSALALLFAPLGAWALGLGDITLRSALNQRLEAEIELVSATPEELGNLRVSLASQETFERYGLERPAYVGGIDFRVGTNNLGRAVILMTSRQAISEPFITVLVEVAWSRGRLLREYTVLLDPPIVLLVPAAVQTIEPAETGAPDATRPAAAIDRPAPERVAQPTVRETLPSVQATPPLQTLKPTGTEAPAPIGGAYGPIKPAETLWSIADRYRPAGITMNQMTVAIYRANPQAFGGNMNTLHQGATLRIPQLGELAVITAGDATQEARRQTALWRGGGADQPARLRLVTPASVEDAGNAPSASAAIAGIAAGSRAPTATAEIVELEGELNMVRDELDYNRRLLEIKDQQLQDLQTQLMAAQDAEARFAERMAAAGVEPEPWAEAGVDLESEPLFAGEVETTPATVSPAVVVPPAAATRVVTTPIQSSWTSRALGWWTQARDWLTQTVSGLTERLGGLTQSISWLTGPILLVGLGVVALIGTAVLYLRRRQQDTGEATGRWEADLDDEDDTLAASVPQPIESDDGDYIVSEQQIETAAPQPLPDLEPTSDSEPEPMLEPAMFAPPEARDDGTTPDLDADILAASQESATLDLPDSLSLDPEGTVPGESSVLDTALESAAEEATDIDLGDLGLDLDADDLPDLSNDDEATEVATDVMSSSGVSDVLDDISAGPSATATGVALDLDDLVSALGDDKTAEVPVEQIVGSDILAGVETDLDVDTTSSQTDLLDPHTMTMTEVGTKLGLARAYVDMGDSDGARAMLEEVVAEGDPAQQTEAQGIIDGL